MSRKKLSRRQFVAATALSSAALITAPYVRGAYAAGKLTMGFWDHWVPDANKASTALVNEWAAKEKVEVSIDYITSKATRTCSPSPPKRRRSPATTSLRCRPGGPMRTRNSSSRERRHGAADQAERRRQRHGAVSRQGRRQMARRSRLHRQPDQGALLAHRPDEEIRQHRRAGNVSGRQPAQSRQLDHGHLPEGGRGLPQGRLSLRHRTRRDQRHRRHRRRDLPVVRRRSSSMPRATSPSRPTTCVRRSSSTRS